MSRKINLGLCIFVSLFLSLRTCGYAATSATTVTVSPNHNPAKNAVYLPSLVLYDEQHKPLDGWDHTGNFADEFTGLQKPVENYRFDGGGASDKTYYSATLVKKLGDWNHQHGNGIIADISANKLLFSHVAAIELLIKIDSANTYLPSKAQIIATYGELVNSAQLNTLDDENVYLSFALFGPVSKTITFNGDYLLKLNASNQLDQWLKVTIPTSLLTTYTEEHYQQQPISLDAAQNHVITGLRIMAETASTKVVRNLLLERFDENTPKLFKEISLSLQYLGLIYSEEAASPKVAENN